MASTLARLVEKAGGDAREAVDLATKRWRQQVRELIVTFTGFRLNHRRGVEREQLGIPVRLQPGLPRPLQPLLRESADTPNQGATELIALWGQDITALRSACESLERLCLGLASISGWEERGTHYSETLRGAQDVAHELEEFTKQATLLKRILGLNEDVLGAYHSTRGAGEIELYWLIIGAVARLLGVSREGLTVTVLAHEMAHAYTHMGMDIDGRRWEGSFSHCETAVLEGIAQFYTHKLVETLRNRGFTDAWRAYNALLPHQSETYNLHKSWAGRFTPEAFRAALMTVRRSNDHLNIQSFAQLLEDNGRLLQARGGT